MRHGSGPISVNEDVPETRDRLLMRFKEESVCSLNASNDWEAMDFQLRGLWL